jgi:hypothetical protein
MNWASRLLGLHISIRLSTLHAPGTVDIPADKRAGTAVDGVEAPLQSSDDPAHLTARCGARGGQ